MEFLKGPSSVSKFYIRDISQVLKASEVVPSGYFDQSGVFYVVKSREKIRLFNTTAMWTQDLLLFTSDQDGVRATKDGFLHVYHERITRLRENIIDPVYIINPEDVRFVDCFDPFNAKVGESGWLFGEREARCCQRTHNLTTARLEEILMEAEAGKQPPFFDNTTAFIRVEPGFAGREVRVIRFGGILDAIVIDVQSRQLVGRKVESMLSERRWGVRPSLIVPVST